MIIPFEISREIIINREPLFIENNEDESTINEKPIDYFNAIGLI